MEDYKTITIENLVKEYADSVKGFELVNYYKGAFPVYKIDLEVVVQRKKEIGLVQEYCLKFMYANNNGKKALKIKNLSDLLGLKEKVIESNVLELHQLDLVTFRFDTKEVLLTEKGIDVLEKNNLIVPELVNYTFIIDGITGEYQIKESLLKMNMIKNQSYVIPFNKPKPLIDNIDLRKLKALVDEDKKLNQRSYIDGNIININSIEKVEKLYRRFNVLVYSNDEYQIELKVFDRNKRIPKYETILLNMLNDNFKIIPTVDRDESIDSNENNEFLEYVNYAKEKEDEVKVVEDNIKKLQNNVNKNKLIEAESDEEYHSKTLRIQELEIELQKEKEKLVRLPKLLNTYDHRPFMMETLKRAESQVVIVSPWIKTAATDVELRQEIKSALMREVKVVICYGISNEIESDVQYALKQLEKLKEDPTCRKYLYLVKLGNTHEKVLVCDKKYVVITSFNWLSFKGDPKRGFRQETGSVIENSEVVEEMLSNLQNRIEDVGNRTIITDI